MYKKLLYLLLALSILGANASYVSAASGQAQKISDVTIDPAKILFDKGDYVIAKSPKLSFPDVEVNLQGNYRVELRDQSGTKVIKTLSKSSGNKYSIGEVAGEKMEATGTEKINEASFSWFRDPTNKSVWMYDFFGRHWHNTSKMNPSVYERPPSGACIETSGPYPNDPKIGDILYCNVVSDYRQGTMKISELTITDTRDKVKIADVDELGFDKDKFDLDNGKRKLQQGNIVSIGEAKIVKADMSYYFDFKARYDVEEDEVYTKPDDPNRGLRYYNSWQIGVIGYVYKYPKMTVWAVEGDDPGGGDPGGPGGPGGSCSFTVSGPSKGTVNKATTMDPTAHGVIKADQRGNEQFDVLQGIPTSENLYANAFGKNYLFQHEFVNNTGTYTFTVNVKKTYTLTWTEKTENGNGPDGKPLPPMLTPMSETEVVEKDYQIVRDFSYWTIDNLEVYGIEKATMENYALPGGSVILTPNGYSAPSVDAKNSDSFEDHVTPASCKSVELSQTIPGGDKRPDVKPEDFTSQAEGAVGQNKVKNDLVTFNGSKIMDNQETEKSAPTPSQIPQPSEINNNVLYKNGNLISSSLVNKANTPSTGTIYYNLVLGIKGGSPKSYPINGINTVTVHTPAVNYSSVSDDRPHNQKINPALDRSAVILDRPFIVTIPTSGQHLNIPGYGNRDYAKYVRNKQVWFPFDVYNADKTIFYPKGQWIDIPIAQLNTTFNLPVWVDEGFYDVLFRTIAENAPPSFTSQPNANTNLAHHVATDVVKVDVVGRLYDFRITDIADFNWETVFRKTTLNSEPTGAAYYVGDKDIDGAPRGNQAPYLLPIRQGSHPVQGYKNIAIKTGYQFSFDLRTKGNMFGTGDAIRITPRFYFVNKDGSNRQEVDLYYHTNDKLFVKVGSADDLEKRQVILNSRLRNVPIQDIRNTAMYLYDHDTSINPITGISRTQYIDNYVANTGKPTWIGKYNWLILPQQVRVFTGLMNAPMGVDQQRKLAAEQQWYGEYSLPARVYVVKQGTNLAEYGRTHNGLDEKSPIFLKNGYIIVRFNVETIRDEKLDQPYLRYYPLENDSFPFDNQWLMEGFQRTIRDPYGNRFDLKDGDIVFYHGDLSSYDDFNSNVTH
ncbi:hypothetical protein E0485_12290 [Paenibacillus albiflavus]|uniref:DUF5704 domain-containing protein n=1 Tax=Paenibacillus albiflavus TaxID=2545760 RepID=A0A4R4EC16_9BACL|nr:DUF5704 domain-containing protein [Paenibacillus albiflavus]TCZ77229.1 hypothetical protein E0485_12290 [Paenibacillus albiflavus]